MIEGVRLGWTIVQGMHMRPHISEVIGLTQEIVDSDNALGEFVRATCVTNFHPVSTARMGRQSDPMAVVDQYCRVRGVEALRVVDASVMGISFAPTPI